MTEAERQLGAAPLETVFTVAEVRDVLATAEELGFIEEDQAAYLAGLFIAKRMVSP